MRFRDVCTSCDSVISASPVGWSMDRDDILARMSEDMKGRVDEAVEMYNAPFARLLGIEIESIERDRVECSMELRPELMNSMGRGHGAAIYGLIDHTFAIACNVSHPCTGQSSTVSFYRPASGRLKAVCVPVNRSRSLEVYDVRVYAENGKLIASATCTGFVLKEAQRWPRGDAPTAGRWSRRTASPARSATRSSPTRSPGRRRSSWGRRRTRRRS